MTPTLPMKLEKSSPCLLYEEKTRRESPCDEEPSSTRKVSEDPSFFTRPEGMDLLLPGQFDPR